MCIDRLSSLLLMFHDGLQKTVEMLILAIIVLIELLKADGQIGPQYCGRVIPP